MTAPDRIETGKVQVDDDWPAVLIRGDHAMHYAMTLQAYLAGGEGAEANKLIHRAVLEGLAKTLASANAHNGVEPVMLTRATPAAMTPDAMRKMIVQAVRFANAAAGEGITIDSLSPELFLLDYSEATGDEDWHTLADRVNAALRAGGDG